MNSRRCRPGRRQVDMWRRGSTLSQSSAPETAAPGREADSSRDRRARGPACPWRPWPRRSGDQRPATVHPRLTWCRPLPRGTCAHLPVPPPPAVRAHDPDQPFSAVPRSPTDRCPRRRQEKRKDSARLHAVEPADPLEARGEHYAARVRNPGTDRPCGRHIPPRSYSMNIGASHDDTFTPTPPPFAWLILPVAFQHAAVVE